ncbi:hypothetical protein BKA66DRAFT_444025 [Pyrenochaeta sp. MPI-SDFR-AT-0127]|nr:hypothetical protein BKA66DRAFT_444025 [Pyrenochaeta sp. MPI-SDFR-AT-0127]
MNGNLLFGFRRGLFRTQLEQIAEDVRLMRVRSADIRPENLEVIKRNVGALRMALTPHGESIAETLRDELRELTTELQALATATRETHEVVSGLMTNSQAPATPVLLEILAELRRLAKGDLKIQRRLEPFSPPIFFGRAQAKVLARERIQATPSPFHELD